MVLLLVINIGNERHTIARTDGECPVAALPGEITNASDIVF